MTLDAAPQETLAFQLKKEVFGLNPYLTPP